MSSLDPIASDCSLRHPAFSPWDRCRRGSAGVAALWIIDNATGSWKEARDLALTGAMEVDMI